MSWQYKYSKEFLDKTLKVWQPRSKEPLTYQDAVEITDNMVGFIKLLHEWDEKEKRKP